LIVETVLWRITKASSSVAAIDRFKSKLNIGQW